MLASSPNTIAETELALEHPAPPEPGGRFRRPRSQRLGFGAWAAIGWLLFVLLAATFVPMFVHSNATDNLIAGNASKGMFKVAGHPLGFDRNGNEIAPHVFNVEDDVFIERDGGRGTGEGSTKAVQWHGRSYRAVIKSRDRRSWGFYTLAGLDEPPPGDAVLVIPGRSSVFDLFRKPAAPTQLEVRVERDHA